MVNLARGIKTRITKEIRTIHEKKVKGKIVWLETTASSQALTLNRISRIFLNEFLFGLAE